MTSNDADIILDLIECAMDNNWSNIRKGLESIGHSKVEVVEAIDALAKLGFRASPTEFKDF